MTAELDNKESKSYYMLDVKDNITQIISYIFIKRSHNDDPDQEIGISPRSCPNIKENMQKMHYIEQKSHNFTDILQAFPDEEWNYEYISDNRSISQKYIKEQLEKGSQKLRQSSSKIINIDYIRNLGSNKFNWASISCSIYITLSDIKNNLDLPWKWSLISYNPNLTMEFVLEMADKPWKWDAISSNVGIKAEDIMRYPDLPWDWLHISSNPNINITLIRYHMKKYNTNEDLDWLKISSNIKISFQEFQENSNLPWQYHLLSTNPSITIDFIKYAPDKDWDWEALSASPSIKLQDIIDNNLPWDYYAGLSENPNININLVKERINERWQWTKLSSNTGITIQDIRDNITLPWNWDEVSYNPGLTVEFVREFKSFVNWKRLSCNRFDYDDFTFNKNMKASTLRRKKEVYSTLAQWTYIHKDISTIVCSYVNWH